MGCETVAPGSPPAPISHQAKPWPEHLIRQCSLFLLLVLQPLKSATFSGKHSDPSPITVPPCPSSLPCPSSPELSGHAPLVFLPNTMPSFVAGTTHVLLISKVLLTSTAQGQHKPGAVECNHYHHHSDSQMSRSSDIRPEKAAPTSVLPAPNMDR